MLLKTHLVFGFFVYFLMFGVVADKVWFLIFLLLAVCFVDIDSKKSKFGRKIFFRPLQLFVKHRGGLHTLFVGLIISGFIFSIYRVAGVGFFVGYVSHLFLDFTTKQGIMLFWPFSKKRVGLGVRTGGLIEDVLFVLLLLADIYLAYLIIF